MTTLMYARTTMRPQDTTAERCRGSMNAFVVVMFLAILITGGLVADGGIKLQAAREASAVAEEAARAGAGQVDKRSAYSDGGRFRVDRDAAIRVARDHLAATGHHGTVSPAGERSFRVTVRVRKPTILLSLAGISQIEVTKTATADLVTGVKGPGR